MHYKVDTLSDLYFRLGNDLLNKGDIVKARGHETKELRSVNIELTKPYNNLMLVSGRKFNLAFALAESLMLFDFEDDSDQVKYYSYFNNNIANFSDDGLVLRGAYSKRVAEQIPLVIKKLRQDSDTRQAVIQIYDNSFLKATTKDTPCTLDLQFLIRNNKLELHTYMRSNDIIWGLPYDIFNFTNLQEVVANTLGIEVGSYYHTVTSMHVYSNHYDLLIDIVSELAVELVSNKDLTFKRTDSCIIYKSRRTYAEQLGLLEFYKNNIVNQRSITIASRQLNAELSDDESILVLEQMKKYNKEVSLDSLKRIAYNMIRESDLLKLLYNRWGVTYEL